ncbi:hypothetical protein EJ08DRAFT_14855 [Tothia fuscella]|uniref:Uncharacterized protein n=1 Tax=Tothia fuscella TaxID=1048955 RepID=A0A9P4P5C0_9PEZI|nr:hypothetical protein EJ08DRAFT_14855 [Tothia fuscella]
MLVPENAADGLPNGSILRYKETIRNYYLERERDRTLLCWTLTAGKDWLGSRVCNYFAHVDDFTAAIKQGFLHSSDLQTSQQTDQLPLASPASAREQKQSGLVPLTPTTSLQTLSGESTASSIPENRATETGNVDRFFESASHACQGRKLFGSKRFSISLGPAATLPGDIICVLFGAIVSFILRPQGNYYSLVGECYVYEVMDGMFARERQQMGVEEEWFELH